VWAKNGKSVKTKTLQRKVRERGKQEDTSEKTKGPPAIVKKSAQKQGVKNDSYGWKGDLRIVKQGKSRVKTICFMEWRRELETDQPCSGEAGIETKSGEV